MKNSKIATITGVVLPVATMASTIGLFYLWSGTEIGTLFYINLVYTLFLELLFFGYIGFLRIGSVDFTGAFYSIMAVWSIYYIVIGVGLMLFSWLIPLMVYITALIVVTLLWIIIGALVTQTDSDHKADMELTKQKNKKLMNR